jgi:guanosine-3',5'-bis(diphosphate) 3'-pyrophosphohydrolase
MSSSAAKASENLLVQRARSFAIRKHRDQRRKYSGEPYAVHLDAVVDILRSQGVESAEILAAAYLHDTVEDTDATIGEIVEGFGETVGELVYWLTDSEKGTRSMRKLMSAWRLGRAPWEAKLIKLADFIDNTADICRKDRHFAPVYLREKRTILEMMEKAEAEALTRLPLYRRAAQIRTLGDYDRELKANVAVMPAEVLMTTAKPEKAPGTNHHQEPEDWVTGDETMTGAQASYLRTLCQEAGEEFHEGLTKAEASKRIEELQAKTGRGRDH